MAEHKKEVPTPEVTVQLQPGQVVAPNQAPGQPGASSPTQPLPSIQPTGLPRDESHRVVTSLAVEAVEPVPPPKPAEHAPPPAAPALATPVPTLPTASPASPTKAEPGPGIAWVGPEFVAHKKSGSWYGGLAGAAIVLAGAIYLLTRDVISTVVVLIGAIVMGVYAGRQPRQMQYQLDEQGVSLGEKFHSYDEFRSFVMTNEGGTGSVIFMPLRRFAPAMSIYYPPENEEKIVDLLGGLLPFEEHQPDLVDRFLSRIRF